MSGNIISKKTYILLPVLIGLSVIGYMFYKDFTPGLFDEIHFTATTYIGIIGGFLFIAGRDMGLIIRYRIITGKALTWKQCTKVNMLCEFTSAITPSNVGGSSLILFFLNREGVNIGKSTALMMACLFLDELFLVVTCPLILLLITPEHLFGDTTLFTTSIKYLFVIVYLCIVLITFFLYTGLFLRPEWIGRIIKKAVKLPFLKRWEPQASHLAENLVVSSAELKQKSLYFWLKAFLATGFSWCSRYMVVVSLLFAFSISGNYLVAFARQFIIWVLMLISPTPGGSGFSEYMFNEYYSDFFPFPAVTLVAAFIWRIITYYSYLIIGAFIVPKWLEKFK